MHGAFVLIVANAVVKIISAIFKIPLTNLFGKEGMGIFNVAFNIYTALFVISTAGLPVAVSKMVAEANALGRVNEVRKILRVAFSSFSIFGGIASLTLLFGARVFTNVVGNSLAYYAVVAISPALFFTTISAIIRGYYQGHSNMVPTAVSQVIEALFNPIVGFTLAYFLLKNGFSMSIAAAGGITGVTVGTAFGSLYLLTKRGREKRTIPFKAHSLEVRSSSAILKKLWLVAIPVTVGASVLSLTNLIDMAVVMNRLQDIGYSEAASNALYGAYGMAVTLFNVPQTLVTAIAISVIPAITTAFTHRDYLSAGRTMESTVRITAILAFPSAAGLSLLSGPIMNLLYFNKPEDAAIAAPLLSTLAIAIIFVSMVSISNAMLQSMGLVNVPVVTMLIGGVVKLVTNYTLVGTHSININGAPIGTTICYAVIAIINFIVITRSCKTAPNVLRVIIKPALSTIGMGIIITALNPILVPYLGSKISVLLTIGAGAFCYFVLLLLVRGLTKADVMLLPKGEKITKALKLR
ncbi:MAG: polysaccharide biosynthesis protein [Clostridiales bacterium]|nr:polysaccharide biosynthesis protein [Clostridiales bacterium]